MTVLDPTPVGPLPEPWPHGPILGLASSFLFSFFFCLPVQTILLILPHSNGKKASRSGRPRLPALYFPDSELPPRNVGSAAGSTWIYPMKKKPYIRMDAWMQAGNSSSQLM